MKKTRFLISSLVAAGIMPVNQAIGQVGDGISTGGPTPDPNDEAWVRQFAQDHQFLLAQHRSHSSHVSHGSHRSGASGVPRSPVYTPPAPRVPRATPTPTVPAPSTRNERSNPPSSILPSSPYSLPQSLYSQPETSDPSKSQIENVVRRVQAGLMAYGYYDGPLDGMVGPRTRSALSRFQKDYNFNVTGTVTPEVLDAFQIVAR